MLNHIIYPVITLFNKLLLDRNNYRDKVAALHSEEKHVEIVESKNPNLFIAGARPFLRWIIGLLIVYELIIRSIGLSLGYDLPGLQIPELLQIMGAVLGVGV